MMAMNRTGHMLLCSNASGSYPMPSRRAFLISGGALSGCALISPGVRVAAAFQRPTLTACPLDDFIHDRRYSLTRRCAEAYQAGGHISSAISGDVTDIWYNQLYGRWQTQPRPLAGSTAYGSFFCLERLAWDAGMRAVLRIDHRYEADGDVHHTVSGAELLVTRMDDAMRDRKTWERAFVQVAFDLSVEALSGRRAQSQFVTKGSSQPDPANLVTWILAPKAAQAG